MTRNESIRSPILSICIPTFNRAHLLESALRSLAPEVKSRTAEVEVIVSDNHSSDCTADVVRRAQRLMPIRYNCNTKNEGMARNILRLTNELARGEFAWILGDDDFILPGGLKKVLQVLRAYPEIDYAFVNLAILPIDKLPSEPFSTTEIKSVSGLSTKARDLEDRYVEPWEELIDPRVDEVFLGSCMVSVFRLARWKAYKPPVHLGGSVWSSLEDAYIVPVVLAHTMIGRRAYFIGQPCVLTIQGGQEWLDHWAVIVAVRIEELLDLYLQLGIDRQRIDRCRHAALNYAALAAVRLLAQSSTPSREYFSIRKFVRQNWRYPRVLAFVLFLAMSTRLRNTVRKRLFGGSGGVISHYLES